MKAEVLNLLTFDPRVIPWQYDLVKAVKHDYDYSLGTHETLCSGSIGSAKTTVGVHLIARHVLEFPGANFGIGRRALPHLKATTVKDLLEHFAGIQGLEVRHNRTSGDIYLPNGSQITAFSWADGNVKKFGSYKLSSMMIEEATETEDKTAYEYALTRVGRVPHIKEKNLFALTNPDSPSHWLYKKYFVDQEPTRHVFLSRTEQNPFLDPSYIEGLKRTLDPKLARRLLFGEWIELSEERIYYAYESDRNWKRNEDYTVNPRFPVRVSFDFNIAKGKPLSVVFAQYIPGPTKDSTGTFHFFDEIVVEGFRTENALEEAASRGLFDIIAPYIIHGDAAGKHGDTRSNLSDYDIIKRFLNGHRTKEGRALQWRQEVPLANPAIRSRHNMMNAFCLNAKGEVRLHAYKRCKVFDEGMRLTALKSGAQFIEDDSKAYQHITTAAGYLVMSTIAGESVTAPTMLPR